MIKLDPRIKMLIVAIISSLAVLIQRTEQLALLFVIDVIAGIILKVDFINFIKRAKHLLIVVISLALIQSISGREGNALISLGNFVLLTDYGLNLGLQFIIRMCIVISSAMIIVTSDIREVTDGLIKLKLPYELAFMMSISIRFLPDFRQDYKDRMTALKLRGIDIKGLSIGKRIKVYTYLLTPSVSSSIIKSKLLAVAMESRAFRAYKKRTMLRELHMKLIDYIILIISLTAFAGALFLLYN